MMMRVPDARRTIILLSNARTIVSRFDAFAIAIGRILDGRPYSMPKQSIAESIAPSLSAGRPAAAMVREFDALRADTARYALVESEINQLGYFFLARGSASRAVDAFELNVRAFPRSANVYDSLGEAQLARGDTAMAIASYRRSLELDPGNSNASTVLGRIARKPQTLHRDRVKH
jgi:tetratricopeptide (TPR) repeat protein